MKNEPLYDVEVLISEMVKCFQSVQKHGTVGESGDSLPSYTEPVSHICLQPKEWVKGVVKKESLHDFFLMAFRYGMCQGYTASKMDRDISESAFKAAMYLIDKHLADKGNKKRKASKRK